MNRTMVALLRHTQQSHSVEFIGAYTDMPAYVEVIDDETGEVVTDDEFDGETETTINKAGSYIVQIYSGNTIMTGEFEIR